MFNVTEMDNEIGKVLLLRPDIEYKSPHRAAETPGSSLRPTTAVTPLANSSIWIALVLPGERSGEPRQAAAAASSRTGSAAATTISATYAALFGH